MAQRIIKPITLVASSVALALGLIACSPASQNDEITQEPRPEQVTEAEQTTELNAGLFLEDFDRTTRPQDDLFRYVNGAWYDNTEIPGDMSSYGAFRILAEENELRLRSIIEDASDL